MVLLEGSVAERVIYALWHLCVLTGMRECLQERYGGERVEWTQLGIWIFLGFSSLLPPHSSDTGIKKPLF